MILNGQICSYAMRPVQRVTVIISSPIFLGRCGSLIVHAYLSNHYTGNTYEYYSYAMVDISEQTLSQQKKKR